MISITAYFHEIDGEQVLLWRDPDGDILRFDHEEAQDWVLAEGFELGDYENGMRVVFRYALLSREEVVGGIAELAAKVDVLAEAVSTYAFEATT